jgi:hypothetical protein
MPSLLLRGLFYQLYTAGGLAEYLMLAGFLLWSLAYVFFIVSGVKDKACPVPFAALLLNWDWELFFVVICPFILGGTVYCTPYASIGSFLVAFLWFALDSVILWLLFRYGRKHMGTYMKKYFYLFTALLLVAGFIGQITFVGFYQDTNGNQYGWLLNLIMSILFIQVFFMRREGGSQGLGLSYLGAWAKMFGSLSIGLALKVWAGDPFAVSSYLTFLIVAVFVTDLLYVALLTRNRLGTL